MSTRNGSEPGYLAAPGVRGRRIAGQAPFWEVHRFWPAGAPDPGGGEGPELASEAGGNGAGAGGRPVLLIHAATLGRRMFLEPDGGFVAHLLRQRDGAGRPAFDVFSLDWRSSNLLFGAAGQALQGPDRAADAVNGYRIDRAAEDDVPAGLAAVAAVRPGVPIALVAHCMGAATVAQSLASRRIGQREEATQPPLGPVVLSTIALFYRLGVDGWLKVADNVIADMESGGCTFVSPHLVFEPLAELCRWPPDFEQMFQTWQAGLFAHGCRGSFCDRLWFLYGGDYRADDMMGIHDGQGPQGLDGHFGAMPMGLYRHIVENCRRGWAARWDVSPRTHAYELLDPEGFRGQDLTLITGMENQVWHRDSIDRMHEWLQRKLGRDGRGGGRPATRFRKRVFDRFGHVDLWWSSQAPAQVFPYLTEVLRTC